jgi:hypothetical protein
MAMQEQSAAALAELAKVRSLMSLMTSDYVDCH